MVWTQESYHNYFTCCDRPQPVFKLVSGLLLLRSAIGTVTLSTVDKLRTVEFKCFCSDFWKSSTRAPLKFGISFACLSFSVPPPSAFSCALLGTYFPTLAGQPCCFLVFKLLLFIVSTSLSRSLTCQPWYSVINGTPLLRHHLPLHWLGHADH